jgi:multiple sugar transport system ATP-binding protein
MAKISLQNIRKVYPGGVEVVPKLNLEIADKEFVVLVGPSGCGKSTTLRMIAGLEEITDGDMYIGERRVNDVAPKDRNIAMVFQSYALYPHMTVYKNMAFGLSLQKMPKDEIDRKVHEVAKILDLEHLLNRKPKALSGGQRQRVALGRAMVREPLSNLDAKLRTSMRAEIARLHKRLGTTFVYVTHDQTEAMTMGDRIVVMKSGIIQQADTPTNLYNKPCNMFVAGFIGSPQMNFIDCTIEKGKEGYGVNFAGKLIPLPQGKFPDKLMAEYAGKTVVLGVRPEDFHTESAFLEMSEDSTVEAEVEIAEMMGAEIYIHAVCGGQKLIVRAPSRVQAESGDHISLAIDKNKIHLFDKETEQAINIK